ncbi:alpha/beta hydrolase [Lichenibacterium dinghuense]|uniref:alpha/beta hydrolase n=1 Tax=Lichenibacterium dinghuense TaxID=2895977 RepID=UPI001F33F524|nr:alpha/beta hydrolase [Lichenibacterium sp. 6Y81]
MTRLRIVAAALACAAAVLPARSATYPDLRYGPDGLQSLDLHVPDGGGPAPVVVYFHGGAFVGGDKHPCAPQLTALLGQRGIAFACADYRLAPAVHFPTPMRDGARAVQWLRAHAADYGLDPSRVALMGLSAGAGVALWVAFHPDAADPASPDPVLRQSTAVAAVVTGNAQATYDPADIAARLHTDRLPRWLAQFYGAASTADLADARFRDAEADASPIHTLHAGGPPVLAWYGKAAEPLPPDSAPADYVHSPAQGEILAETARERGAPLTLRTAADTGGWRGFLGEAVDFLANRLGR